MTKTIKSENGDEQVYQGGLIDGLIATVNAVVPPQAATPRQSSRNGDGLLLTIDEVLERIKKAAR